MNPIYRSWPLPGASALDDDQLAASYRVQDRLRPWLRVNFVTSADGAVTENGVSGGLSSKSDKRVFGILRRLCDVVLVGAGTVRIEGYGAMRLGNASTAWRIEHGLPPQPVFAIASGALDLDPASAIFTEAPVRPVIFTTERAPADSRKAFQPVADVVVCGDDGIDAAAMRSALIDRGLPQILCEGGPTLFDTLLAAGLVDELCLTVSSRLEGGGGIRILNGALKEPRQLVLGHALIAEDDLILRYLLG